MTEAKRLSPRDWVSFGTQAVGTIPFAFTGTCCSSQELGRMVPLHLCFDLTGEVGNNSTFSPNLVLAASWEEKRESAVQLGWQYQMGSNAVASHLSLITVDISDSLFSWV